MSYALKSLEPQEAKHKSGESGDNQSLGPCPVCGRELVAGMSVDRHHWLPKSRGGKEAAPLHLICHRKIHSLFSRKELAGEYGTPEAVRCHPEMHKFIKWVRRQPLEMVDRHRKPRGSR